MNKFLARIFHVGAAALGAVVMLGSSPASGAAPAADGGPAKQFIERFGEVWVDHFAAEYDSAYPFGRSNKKHDDEIAQSLTLDQASDNRTLTNKRYLFDGDWYVVQWIYGATTTKTGKRQTESTVAFGRVKDDKLIVWEEYFDDVVGELQFAGKLPLYQPDEEPFPWPAGRRSSIRTVLETRANDLLSHT